MIYSCKSRSSRKVAVAIVVAIVAIVVAGPFVGPIGAQLMSRPGTYDHCIYSGFLQSVLLNEQTPRCSALVVTYQNWTEFFSPANFNVENFCRFFLGIFVAGKFSLW